MGISPASLPWLGQVKPRHRAARGFGFVRLLDAVAPVRLGFDKAKVDVCLQVLGRILGQSYHRCGVHSDLNRWSPSLQMQAAETKVAASNLGVHERGFSRRDRCTSLSLLEQYPLKP